LRIAGEKKEDGGEAIYFIAAAGGCIFDTAIIRNLLARIPDGSRAGRDSIDRL